MQSPQINIKISTIAAILLSGGGVLISNNPSRLLALWVTIKEWCQSVPLTMWFLMPLAITLTLALLARFDVLQKLFGSLYKDLTDADVPAGHRLTDRDKQRLTQLLETWHAPMPHLARADSWLALWSGRERWSVKGFDQCWLIALVYPLLGLLLMWAISNNGALGTAEILPPVNDAWNRWALLFIVAIAFGLVIGLARLSQQSELPNVHSFKIERIVRTFRQISIGTRAQLTSALVLTFAIALGVAFFFTFSLNGLGALVGTVAVAVIGTVTTALAFAKGGPVALACAILVIIVFDVVIVSSVGSSFAGFYAIAFSFAVFITVAWVGALAGAFAFVGAFVGALAFFRTGTFAFFSVLVLALPIVSLLISTDEIMRNWATQRRTSEWRLACGLAFGWACMFAIAVSVIPMCAEPAALQTDSASFSMIVFFGAIPLINGFSDWISLNATRTFIARMQAGATRGTVARMYLWDVAVAISLTFVVYSGMLALFWGMQSAGWSLDLRALLTVLHNHPWEAQSSWLVALAITNIVPTLVHLVLWAFYGVEARDVDTHEQIEQFMRDGGVGAPRQIAPTIIYLLKLKPWLEKFMVLSLTLALVPIFTIWVPWGAGLVLRWM